MALMLKIKRANMKQTLYNNIQGVPWQTLKSKSAITERKK